ncbi:hypothetical protein GCM10028803_56560 [Larkinella knui]
MLLTSYPFVSQAQNVIYVASTGKAESTGSFTDPIGTIEKAVEVCRKTAIKTILVRGGKYYGVNVKFTPADSGLVIKNYKSEVPIFYGGVLLKSLTKQDSFITAPIPGAKNYSWDFRLLVVNGSIRPRSRLPDIGSFSYFNKWNVKLLPASEGSWERQPTRDELQLLHYDPSDITSLDVENAEISLYHQWSESYSGVKSIDTTRHVITLSSPATKPLGSFAASNKNANKYVVWNTRAGLKKPGQWFLDRSSEKIYYLPFEGENINNLTIIAPKYSNIFQFSEGSSNITIQGIILTCAANSLQNEGFAAQDIDAAIYGQKVKNIKLAKLTIEKSSGSGIKLSGNNIIVDNTLIQNINGGGIYLTGSSNGIMNTEIRNVGLLFKGAVGIFGSGKNNLFSAIKISNVPYSGICGIGDSSFIFKCNLQSTMLFMQDGAAIYSGRNQNIKIVKNILIGTNNPNEIGIYFDELSSNCTADSNLLQNIHIPIHCHIASNVRFSTNVLINNSVQIISCQRSKNIKFDKNTLFGDSIVFNGHGQSIGGEGLSSFYRNRLISTFKSIKFDTFLRSLPLQKNYNVSNETLFLEENDKKKYINSFYKAILRSK